MLSYVWLPVYFSVTEIFFRYWELDDDDSSVDMPPDAAVTASDLQEVARCDKLWLPLCPALGSAAAVRGELKKPIESPESSKF